MDDNPANAGGPIPRRNVPSPPFERYERPRDTPPKPSMRPDDDGVPSRTRVPVIDAPESPEPKDGPPKLRRGIIFDDGAVKCVFSDRSSMVLDPTGECFTAHDSWSGETTRQLSEFAISRFAPRLRAALEFRNTHVDVPFCPPCVSKPAAFRRAAQVVQGREEDIARALEQERRGRRGWRFPDPPRGRWRGAGVHRTASRGWCSPRTASWRTSPTPSCSRRASRRMEIKSATFSGRRKTSAPASRRSVGPTPSTSSPRW